MSHKPWFFFEVHHHAGLVSSHMSAVGAMGAPVGAAVAEVTADLSWEWCLVQQVICEGTVRPYWLRFDVCER